MDDSVGLPPDVIEAMCRAGGGWLAAGRETVIAAAPGRLDVMGGIADYSGAVVLEGTTGDAAAIALQRREDDVLRVRTVGPEAARLPCQEFSLRIDDFYNEAARPRAALKSYPAVSARFPAETRWAAYVLGVFYVLLAEGELAAIPGGADLLVHSTVPLGAGVASSAALVVAAMRAVAAAFGARTAGPRLAALCQMVENRVVGAPCGIMDQVTCALGRAGELLALRCQPHDVLGWHAPPPGFAFVGLDSGVKHAVGGQRYPLVRCAAFMGRRIIQDTLEACGEDPQRAAYLCNLTPLEYRARFRDVLPARLPGREFLRQWGETGDPATTLDPDASYPVRGATEHPIYENARVRRFIAFMTAGRMRAAGRLMYGSHRSYSRHCGLGSPETDLLVSLIRKEGPAHGLLGAKITGGGSGGTVAVLLETSGDGQPSPAAAEAVKRVREAYAHRIGRLPRPITGSRPGAQHMPPVRLPWPGPWRGSSRSWDSHFEL